MKKISRKLVLLLSLVAVLAITVGGTLAYLQATTGLLTNTFKLADVHTKIEEELSDTKQVSILNEGESDVYVRVRLSLSGLTEAQMGAVQVISDGDVTDDEYAAYKGADCITILTHGKWAQTTSVFNPDGFFYYTAELGAKQKTELPLEIVVGSGAGVTKEQNFEVIVYHESVLARTSDLTDASKIAEQFE
ncbi:hypothetical protein [uncultured Allofournierella sp.]|uniref:hypothetical protein n=1 Tax=uncultured Allofournierella sp. TaxID=1940258 RepID=UPI0025E29D9F|nr:hypothetical protein [uncultured Fournierella sp.]